MVGLKRLIKHAKNWVIKQLGGVTEGQAAHLYRRTKTLATHNTLSRGQVFWAAPRVYPSLTRIYGEENESQRWIAILVDKA